MSGPLSFGAPATAPPPRFFERDFHAARRLLVWSSLGATAHLVVGALVVLASMFIGRAWWPESPEDGGADAWFIVFYFFLSVLAAGGLAALFQGLMLASVVVSLVRFGRENPDPTHVEDAVRRVSRFYALETFVAAVLLATEICVVLIATRII